ncbi:succinyl-diaminopimelate desuccinylase [Kangiella geojedonensis]|uniref:Succinyl-diaminopimelate desuccinylase n=1 Tax=Kangiella geojedonensis TaxID=914150 RepID=A0A0F6TRY7_9GAMM|nr:succinyl-diaminopimelate desuccinylase [Kangiella geojedonensis]AKE52559.1 succinyl-diaminopimelate desuccinylase [Kangiella geojedonensis]
MSTDVITLAKNLINRESVTPIDAGCQKFMMELLGRQGFAHEIMDFEDTQNFWSVRKGKAEGPVFVFAGHTDVVPAGNLEDWHTPPFEATEIDGYLHGRGAADMKGSLAAMLAATDKFVADYPDHQGSIAYLITSDEEGPFVNGTVRVVEELMKRQQPIDYCIVGEPSSTERLGDVIKNGRRGSLTGFLKVLGTQGHVAYPHLADNAIHKSYQALSALTQEHWDHGNDFFPPTSFQIAIEKAGTATNVIPGEKYVEFNFRYSTESTADGLKQRVVDILDKHELDYELNWKLNGEPFLTPEAGLLTAAKKAIKETCNIDAQALTSGGTSDGRFIAKTGAEVVEIGPVNKTIHQINECVNIDDLRKLVDVYYSVLKQLLAK